MTAPDLRTLDLRHWPRRWIDEWNERAAIIQDGTGCSNEEAEAKAREVVITQWQREMGLPPEEAKR